MIKILIADDHAIVRRGLVQILKEKFSDAVFGEASNGHDVLREIRAHKWNLLTLDISLPDRSGIDLLEDIQLADPNLPVLMLSVHPEDQYGRRVLKAGAAGYMRKDAAPRELTDAVLKILRGGKYVSPSLGEKLASDLLGKPAESKHDLLSDRELEVLRMMASGKTVTNIAETLTLSSKTVSTYRVRILEKMGLSTTAELIRYAVEHHLVG